MLDIQKIKSKLGANLESYMSLPKLDGPVSTLKEISTQKILNSIAKG
ncbi:hypothetical protein [Candidatus Mesenet endosymbiont of Phosphuga atrata]